MSTPREPPHLCNSLLHNYTIAVAEYRLLPPRLNAQLPAPRQPKQVVAQVEVPNEN